MLHLLLRVAAALFLIWLIFTVIGWIFYGLIHLIWIAIIVLVVIWLVQRASARGRSRML
jgi:hypothetical protein